MLAPSLRTALRGFDVEEDVPAASLTTWRVGGPIDAVVRVHDTDDLRRLSKALPGDVPVVVIGRGSNLLVADAGFAGIAVVLAGALDAIAEVEAARGADRGDVAVVRAGGAVALPVLARRCAAGGHAGLEFFVGIPGSVGGAVRMNAGGHGADTASVLVDAAVLTLGADDVVIRDAAGLEMGFRRSAVGWRDVVVEARFRVTRDDPQECGRRIEEIVRWRREHQPGGANAGSVFVNPLPRAAAELIDGCGLKGRRVGGAFVSEKHANFIQADDGATAADVVALIDTVQREVGARTGVWLTTEVRMIGFEDPQRRDEEVRP